MASPPAAVPTPSTRPKPLQHDPTAVRTLVCGPDSPSLPYPLYLSGPVQKGFGRGSRDLGCPTANLPDEEIGDKFRESGVYYGWAKLGRGDTEGEGEVRAMVMSVGWNPVYGNDKRTAEAHILHDFGRDFYGELLRVVVLGFIRPEYNYTSLDALVKDIDIDKQAAEKSLDRPAYLAFRKDRIFDD